MAAAILVTGVVFGSAGLADRGNSGAQQVTNDPAQRETNVPISPVPPSATQPGGSPTVLGRPTVELRWTHGQSWVRVIDYKGNIVINDIYNKGTVKKFTGRSFLVEIGNAGAITVIKRGGKPRIAGKEGQAASVTVIGP